MTVSLPLATAQFPAYAIPEKALRRWAQERLQRIDRADGGTVYAFALAGSTCSNVPLELVMSVVIDADGRIEATSSRERAGITTCDAMCAAQGEGRRFLDILGNCDEVIGLTLAEAAFRKWDVEPSGCLCTAGNRRHKWRNVLQALHYAATHAL